MEEIGNIIELLIERAAKYGKTSLLLIKLKTIDKASLFISTFVSYSVVAVFVVSFMLFLSLGLALWLGEILGKIYYGFFVIAAIYGFTAIFIRLVMYSWLKKLVSNNFIKQALK